LTTVTTDVAETLPDTAVIVVVPAATEVASPFEPAALLIVATPVLDELQVTDLVRFWLVLSEYVPVAVNCWLAPLAIFGFAGVTEIEMRVVGLIVREAVPRMLPEAAMIVAVPASTDVASPCEPAALLIVATPVLEELQVTELVRFWELPSE